MICHKCKHCLYDDVNISYISVAPGNTSPDLESTEWMGRHQKWMNRLAPCVLQIPHWICAWYRFQPQFLNMILLSQINVLALPLHHIFYEVSAISSEIVCPDTFQLLKTENIEIGVLQCSRHPPTAFPTWKWSELAWHACWQASWFSPSQMFDLFKGKENLEF